MRCSLSFRFNPREVQRLLRGSAVAVAAPAPHLKAVDAAGAGTGGPAPVGRWRGKCENPSCGSRCPCGRKDADDRAYHPSPARPTGPHHASASFARGLVVDGGGGRIRTHVRCCGQIYSLLPLTTRPPLHGRKPEAGAPREISAIGSPCQPAHPAIAATTGRAEQPVAGTSPLPWSRLRRAFQLTDDPSRDPGEPGIGGHLGNAR